MRLKITFDTCHQWFKRGTYHLKNGIARSMRKHWNLAKLRKSSNLWKFEDATLIFRFDKNWISPVWFCMHHDRGMHARYTCVSANTTNVGTLSWPGRSPACAAFFARILCRTQLTHVHKKQKQGEWSKVLSIDAATHALTCMYIHTLPIEHDWEAVRGKNIHDLGLMFLRNVVFLHEWHRTCSGCGERVSTEMSDNVHMLVPCMHTVKEKEKEVKQQFCHRHYYRSNDMHIHAYIMYRVRRTTSSCGCL